MMPGFLWHWTKRFVLLLVGIVFLLLLPSAYVELFCRAEFDGNLYDPIISDAQFQRPEANSYLTYPEWHIVFAYEGLANVLKTGDEHEFDYLGSIGGFWSSACALNRTSQQHGEADFVVRGIIHIIGVSFTVEMGMKALYEETLGRAFAAMRGKQKTPQDIFASSMANDYAEFLQQTPWFEYDFDQANEELWEQPMTGGLRSWERRLALGGEWWAKSGYASMIGGASDAAGPAILRIRLVVAGVPPQQLDELAGVEIIETKQDFTIIEADRYRKLTRTLVEISAKGGKILEIAGNDDILLTAIRPTGIALPTLGKGKLIADLRRQGYSDRRALIDVPVVALAELITSLDQQGLLLEHIYDY